MSPLHLFIIIAVLAVVRAVLHFSKRIRIADKKKKVIFEYLDSIIVAGAIALVLITFIVRTFYIPSDSMVPTLVRRDMLMVNEFIYHFRKPARKEIIVFHPPPEAHLEGKDLIKRIVAVENDDVEVKDGTLFINGEPQEEPYIREKPEYQMEARKVPPGCLFVMGDNRNNSADSHVWGFLPCKNVMGKAFVIFWPPGRIRILK